MFAHGPRSMSRYRPGSSFRTTSGPSCACQPLRITSLIALSPTPAMFTRPSRFRYLVHAQSPKSSHIYLKPSCSSSSYTNMPSCTRFGATDTSTLQFPLISRFRTLSIRLARGTATKTHQLRAKQSTSRVNHLFGLRGNVKGPIIQLARQGNNIYTGSSYMTDGLT